MRYLAFIALAVCTFRLASADEKTRAPVTKPVESTMSKMTVNPYGKYFADHDHAITIEMAIFEGKNENGLSDVLLRISGAEAHNEGIDGKVIRYKAEPAGTGVNFQYEYNGQPTTRMLSRDSLGGWNMFEAFVGEKKFKVYLDAKKASNVKPLHMLTAYKESK